MAQRLLGAVLALMLVFTASVSFGLSNANAQTTPCLPEAMGELYSGKIDIEDLDFTSGQASGSFSFGLAVRNFTITIHEVKDGNEIIALKITPPAGFAVEKYCVKAGNDPKYFDSSDRDDLTVIFDENQKGISNFSVWFVKVQDDDDDEVGQWCSPGFWRNSLIQAREIAGPLVTAGSLRSDWEAVLADPSKYARTGEYEAVADILSEAHAGVDFQGDRVKDSCPLSADASTKKTS